MILFGISGMFFHVDICLYISEDIKVLIEKIQKNLKSARPNCDDFFNAGYQADGVKLLFSGKRLFNAYCEFNKSGHNWMVNMSTDKPFFDVLRKIIIKIVFNTISLFRLPVRKRVQDIYSIEFNSGNDDNEDDDTVSVKKYKIISNNKRQPHLPGATRTATRGSASDAIKYGSCSKLM